MKIKNINPLERHAEKITLALAVLAAGWLAYNNFAKNPDAVSFNGSKVAPGRVESQVATAVRQLRLRLRQDRQKNLGQTVHVPNYVRRYRQMVTAPLQTTLVAVGPVMIGPEQPAFTKPSLTNFNTQYTFVVPTVPRLTAVKATAHRGVAQVDQGQTRDVTWVHVRGQFHMLRWRGRMAGVGLKKKNVYGLPVRYQQTLFRQVQVRRQVLQPDGQWGQWHAVKGLYLQPLPKVHLADASRRGVVRALRVLRRHIDNIIEPPFYQILNYQPQQVSTGSNGNLNQRQVRQRERLIQRSNRRNSQTAPGGAGGFNPMTAIFRHMRQGGGAAPGGPGGPGGPGAPGAPNNRRIPAWILNNQRQPGATGGPAGGWQTQGVPVPGVAGGVGGAGVSQGLTGAPVLNIRFFDTSVTPGLTYRYCMRVVLYNPTYRFGYKLTVPAAKKQPWLASAWSKPTDPVRIKQSRYFFLVSNHVHRGQVAFRIYMWTQGNWVVADDYVSPGEHVGAMHNVSYNDPATGQLARKPVNFDTGYLLVDASAASAGGGVNAVLLAPSHNLVIRNSVVDSSNPRRFKLDHKIQQMTRQAVRAQQRRRRATQPPARFIPQRRPRRFRIPGGGGGGGRGGGGGGYRPPIPP